MATGKLELLGRLAVVTGAAGGIGKAISTLFAQNGCSIVLVDRAYDQVKKVAAELATEAADAKHSAYCADVSSSQDIKKVLTSVVEEYKQAPSILINNAGIIWDQFLIKMEEQQFDEVIAVNLKGTFLFSQEVAKLIREHKVPNASIVNISSVVAKFGNIGQTNYSAAKAGVIGLTKTCAKELARYDIRCNAVLPGFITTAMTEHVPEHILAQVKFLTPLKKLGTPEDVAELCMFLASSRSKFITGEAITVSGGFNV